MLLPAQVQSGDVLVCQVQFRKNVERFREAGAVAATVIAIKLKSCSSLPTSEEDMWGLAAFMSFGLWALHFRNFLDPKSQT